MRAWWLGKWGQMSAFKRIVFCLLFFGSFSFLFVKVDAGHSQWNVLGPMVIMWLLSSLAVPGRHVPYLARIFTFPLAVYFGRLLCLDAYFAYIGFYREVGGGETGRVVTRIMWFSIFTFVTITGSWPSPPRHSLLQLKSPVWSRINAEVCRLVRRR